MKIPTFSMRPGTDTSWFPASPFLLFWWIFKECAYPPCSICLQGEGSLFLTHTPLIPSPEPWCITFWNWAWYRHISVQENNFFSFLLEWKLVYISLEVFSGLDYILWGLFLHCLGIPEHAYVEKLVLKENKYLLLHFIQHWALLWALGIPWVFFFFFLTYKDLKFLVHFSFLNEWQKVSVSKGQIWKASMLYHHLTPNLKNILCFLFGVCLENILLFHKSV